MSNEQVLEDLSDIFIISKLYIKEFQEIYDFLEKSNEYVKYEFEGNTFVKSKKFETEGYWFFVKN